MSRPAYPAELISRLENHIRDPQLAFRRRLPRYEDGRELTVRVTGVSPATRAKAVLNLDRFLGGGFAGQVYRATLKRLETAPGETIPGLVPGRRFAVKIIIPPSGFSRFFRDAVFKLGFQGPFSAQTNESACRAGLLLQKMIRAVAGVRFGRLTAVKDAYASFHDPELGSYGEITEWVEGRCWRLETDGTMHLRSRWRTIDSTETDSPEYIATRRFMADMVAMLHDMGAGEFARQYEWWTMKSQPNVMIRTDVAADTPEQALCAIDFRAGLALLPFLPMSPADIPLILKGLLRGRLVQFDRCDVPRLREFVARHAESIGDCADLLDELEQRDGEYRRSLPDITRRGLGCLATSEARRAVREGQIEGYLARDLTDSAGAATLRTSGIRFILFFVMGLVPLLGRGLRRLAAHAGYRAHLRGILTQSGYRGAALRSRAARTLLGWVRGGRCDPEHAEFLLRHPVLCLLEAFTLGLIPVAFVHRSLVRPSFAWNAVRERWRFSREFWFRDEFREQWLLGLIEEGREQGMLRDSEAAAVAERVREPFIIKYLRCVAVHFATLPVTQIVSVTVGAVVAGTMLARGSGWPRAVAAFSGIVALFQVIPISPGSLCRGGFVLYLMIRERNWRDYLIACPLSFVKYIGYLAFPLQMTTRYPALARFMSARWATNVVHIVPVFGERGALLEHMVFDMAFNVPRRVGMWMAPRLHWVLTGWLCTGLVLGSSLMVWKGLDPLGKGGINLILFTIGVFFLPRLLFYPLLTRQTVTD